jgi:hypothetical protein
MKKIMVGVALFSFMLLCASCSSKLKCSKFYTYSTRKVDIKGISAKLKKQGADIGDFSIGEISIDPKFVTASEELQKLDLLQYSLCAQIKGLPKKDSLRKDITRKYTSTLIQMFQVAKKPDSLLSSKIERLESREEERTVNETKMIEVKNTIPVVDGSLVLNQDKSIHLQVSFKNDVPIKFDYFITHYKSDTGIDGHAILEKPTIHPTSKKKHSIYLDGTISTPGIYPKTQPQKLP